jgi:hypothetical protein
MDAGEPLQRWTTGNGGGGPNPSSGGGGARASFCAEERRGRRARRFSGGHGDRTCVTDGRRWRRWAVHGWRTRCRPVRVRMKETSHRTDMTGGTNVSV